MEDTKLISFRQGVFQTGKVCRNQLKSILCNPDVQQVVAQTQIQQSSLPKQLFGEGCLSFAARQIIWIHALRSGVRGISVYILIFLYFPYLSVQYALRDRADSRMPGPSDVDGEDETARIAQFAVRAFHGVVEVGIMSHIHAGGFYQRDVVDSFGSSFGQQGYIVDGRVRKGFRHQPAACESMPFGDDDEGIQSDGFEAGSIKQCHIQTGSELLCQYGICQTDTLPVLFEAGGNGAVNNLLFGEGGVDGCHLLSHTVRIAALVFVQ